MSEILPCPNPKCQGACDCIDMVDNPYIECCLCFYHGPVGKNKSEAIRLHNLICRPSSGGDANRQEPVAWASLGTDAGRLYIREFRHGWEGGNDKYLYPLYEHPAPSVATEEQRPVAWVIKLRGVYQCVTSDPLIKMARESDGYTSEPLFSHPSPSQDAIMGAAREIIAICGAAIINVNIGGTVNLSELHKARTTDDVAFAIRKHLGEIKHLGPVKHE